ncbi:unnamed protein product [Aspergillus oryzae var. brunneus]|uniref:Unnamed protein product n=1 Tax=Aspergillus oryzae var. brunneus TaxID=332754 RepID=A0ABQ6L328_ASPOZ|nr:hypothetical protein NYO67_1304 [Aspergillus flavus]RAQ53286.1 hypothetical protein AFGD_001759 [Aspergillus flavus]GMG52351.1 unnamed protein product [Aspergillus oryzae var. brunneus]
MTLLTKSTDTTPPTDRFHTCPHPHHTPYSEINLPPILFRMDAPIGQDLPDLSPLRENGQVARDHEDKEIWDFPFLPRYITSSPPGWLLEYWMRTDPRLTYRDIRVRMAGPLHLRPHENALNMRRERDARRPLRLSCWTYRRGTPGRLNKIDVERVERWSIDQIRYNTTMDVVYADGGPVRLEDRALAAHTPATYPLDYFLNQGRTEIPSERIRVAQSVFFRLSERAKQLGLGSWRQLPDNEWPDTFRYNISR